MIRRGTHPLTARLLAVAAAALAVAACAGGGDQEAGSSPRPSSPERSASTSPTPTPAAPTPYAAVGAVVIQEDFENAADHHFRSINDASLTADASDGIYQLVLGTNGMPHGELHRVAEEQNTVTITLDMAARSPSPDQWYGPICFYNNGWGFSLRVTGAEAYELVQVSVQGEPMATLSSGPLPGDAAAGVAHRLRLDCVWQPDATSVTAFIDGAQIGPATDPPSGLKNALKWWSGLGFWAMSESAPAEYTVDNVMITQGG